MPLFVAAFTFLVFLPALKDGFLNWDDLQNLVNNQKYRGLGYLQLKWMFTSYQLGPYTPLPLMTQGLDYLLWGMDPFGYHLTNVVLHSLNALVFFFLCVKLLALAITPSLQEKRELYLSAGFAALFFAVHPLRAEPASWLSGRHDILSCLFYMLAVLWYLAPRSAGGEKLPFWRRHLLPLAAFLLALLSKGMAVSLPVVLLLLDVYPLRRLPGAAGKWFARENRPIWLEKVPFFALAAVFGAIGYALQADVGALSSFQKFGFAPRAAQVLFSVFFYVRKTLIPLELSPLYRLPAGFGLLNWQSLLAGFAITALTAAAIALRRRWPAGLAAWAFYLAALSPVAGFVKINTQAAADRYTYLPCLGFAVLAGAGFRACRRAAGGKYRSRCALIAVLIISGLAFLTWRQEGTWRDSETLWRHALKINPELDIAHHNLAGMLALRGKTDEAEAHYREALRLNPYYAKAHGNLGLILAARGRMDEAAGHYREALKLNPGDVEAHNALGLALAEQGRTDEAAWHYREASRLDPAYPQARINLGLVLAAQGKQDEAARQYSEALRLNPGSVEAHNNLGVVMINQGKLEEAAGHYREALKLKPDCAQARYNLGLIQAALEKRAKLAPASGRH
ncbi:MAG: tetratricopeptide repeat protein [Elusimicrobiota bacterium]